MQKYFYLATNSLTEAMKAQRILAMHSVNSRVEKVANMKPNGGCGYCVVVFSQPQKAVEMLRKRNINTRLLFQR